jgi:hypothetical protein
LMNDFFSITSARPGPPFAALRRYLRPRPAIDRCELCALELAAEHQHLLELPARKLVCACDACALLFDGRHNGHYRRVPRRVESWPDFRLTDAQWEDLSVPIGLAFFFESTPAGKVLALYPSPAGATEAVPPAESWQQLVDENPALRELEPDVEALLVNRVGTVRECYRAPIDECFKLAGLIRMHWRGFSGGTEVWQEIGRFFDSLKQRSQPKRGGHG